MAADAHVYDTIMLDGGDDRADIYDTITSDGGDGRADTASTTRATESELNRPKSEAVGYPRTSQTADDHVRALGEGEAAGGATGHHFATELETSPLHFQQANQTDTSTEAGGARLPNRA